MSRKKRILYISDSPGVFTGFGKACKLILKHLYSTGKYEITQLSQGLQNGSPLFLRFPWKTEGAIPTDPNIINEINQDPGKGRAASYGEFVIEDVVKRVKPDVIFSVNDSWGNLFVADKEFFKHIPTVCWTTFDSLPLLPDTVDKAPKIKHYWAWSSFAENEFKRLGHNHVKTQYPPVNLEHFKPLPLSHKKEIRKKHGIPENAFIVNFTFRNQLRKLVNTLLEGYALFRKEHNDIKNTFLHLHTNFSEGWDIPRLCKQYGVNENEVLATYVCRETGDYFILPYKGQDLDNPKTQSKKTLITVNIQNGISEEQLNECYNIADFYCHPATSGACEIPCVEAAAAGKIVATCDYAYGEDIIRKNKGSIPIEYTFYAEHGTQFLKSQPRPFSIAKIMHQVYSMKPMRRAEMEEKSRQWALENYSHEKVCKEFEDFIDSLHSLDDAAFDYADKKRKYNPSAVIPQVSSDKEYVLKLYQDILDLNPDEQDSGRAYWEARIKEGMPRQQIESFFRQEATKEIQKEQAKDLNAQLDQVFGITDKKKVLVTIKESLGDIILLTSLLKDFRQKYPKEEYHIFLATEPKYFEAIEGNQNIDSLVAWHPALENELFLMGAGNNKKYIDHFYYPAVQTQKFISYLTGK